MFLSNKLYCIVLLLCALQGSSQTNSFITSISIDTDSGITNYKVPALSQKFPTRKFVVPAIMILYGFSALEAEGLETLNDELKEEIWLEKAHPKQTFDNYLQFAPAAAVYALNALGIKGRHGMVERSSIFVLSNVFTLSSVSLIKKTSNQLRPDGSAYNSFPSGHTAEAFACAEFLRQEYRDVSPWIGIAGYAVATTTGYLRMYNNKHWLSDIVAGAGIGIASTKLAYWLMPKIKSKFSKRKKMPVNTVALLWN